MHFDLIESLSLAGRASVPNDDRAGSADRHAWVIDGATDLGDPGLLGERGGAAWLAMRAQAAFCAASGSGSLEAICGQVFDALSDAYARERRRDPVSSWELPRAAFAAVALQDDEVACAWLGDCTVIHRGAGGVAFLTPAPDRGAESAEAAALGPGAGAGNVRTPEVLADRRAARERPKPVLGVDAAQAKQGTRHARAPVRRGDDILLMSDGFAALIDAYAVYDAPALVSRMAEAGLAALGRELRQIERDDAACLRYPRFKASDDATALWLRVG
ncbi:Uncharacterised protein [Bordetella ansorpii]|uniref:PPM-type phosphatase domain-containing protein n=1 Tax=Bordetella ansorpii TaxID=288768 RepID=A0A157Q2K1_9BORD|nr:protein phosphatase 2C domain-containing protein [Bordetella ansorpii]SAI40103.1 Uncharacterised protein [Bordetella ansorpii]